MAVKFKNVIFHESVDDPKIALDNNDIYILTSDIEGYPISLIEAISRKMPIILRNTFASASEIVDGNGVILKSSWDDNDFRLAVLDCYSNYEKYSERSDILYSKYSPSTIKNYWIYLLKSIYNNE